MPDEQMPTKEQLDALQERTADEPAPDDNKPYGIPEEGDDE